MNLYDLFKVYGKIKSKRIKLFGVFLFHIFGKRYLGVFIDPVLACNFRCKMCYFSDPEKRKNLKGTLSSNELILIARSLFHRALKLQIGCGAEPILSRDLVELVRLGTQHKVPYISLTTNGSLLSLSQLNELIEAGLHEITISTHGILRATYEDLMERASYDDFQRLLTDLREIKEIHPAFKIRINYTINADNFKELKQFWFLFQHVPVDILQLRPVQKIGNTKYTNFQLTELYNNFDQVILPLVHACKERNTTCIYPDKENLIDLETESDSSENEIENFTYCYISPRTCWENDFDYHTDSFESYSKRVGLGKKILKTLFKRKKRATAPRTETRKMNYTVD